MRLLNLTLRTAAENLALDEALLAAAETAGQPSEVLRLWEAERPLVVVGRSSRVEQEVRLDHCRADGVPVVRRPSGGAAIVGGPGCLMYALVLSYEQRPELRSLDIAHRFVLQSIAAGLSQQGALVERQGTSDLALGRRKFSGNSVRVKRNHFLYHGTLLYDFPLASIERYLGQPPQTPEYRQGRSHEDFVANLPLDRRQLQAALIAGWQARETAADWPGDLTQQLVVEKYGRADWNFRH